jgi:hypothetical protein
MPPKELQDNSRFFGQAHDFMSRTLVEQVAILGRLPKIPCFMCGTVNGLVPRRLTDGMWWSVSGMKLVGKRH